VQDVHEAQAALDVARLAAVKAARSVVTRGKDKVLTIKPATATGKAIAERPKKPNGLALLLQPVRCVAVCWTPQCSVCHTCPLTLTLCWE
jgi:hypothetical protein